jgi:hypothetical protein
MKLWKPGTNRLIASAVGLFLLAGFGLVLAPAVKAAGNIVVEGFSSKEVLQPGLVVSLDASSTKSVKAAPAGDENLMYGVVVDPSDAPLTVNNKGSQVFVASSGIYRVLVSTINGPIKMGDYLSMSTLDGIAAKATPSQTTTLGQAEANFDGSSNVITNNGGQAIGRIYVNLTIQKNPFASSDPVPAFLRRTAVALANKPVPVARIYTALIIFVIAAIATVTILWSGVRSSLVSLGRNPLSRHIILGGLYKVIFTGLAVFAIGLAGVYLLLKI